MFSECHRRIIVIVIYELAICYGNIRLFVVQQILIYFVVPNYANILLRSVLYETCRKMLLKMLHILWVMIRVFMTIFTGSLLTIGIYYKCPRFWRWYKENSNTLQLGRSSPILQESAEIEWNASTLTREENSNTLPLGHSSPIMEPAAMEWHASASSSMDLQLDRDSSESENRKKGRHSAGFKRICGKKVPWSNEEKSAALTSFSTYLAEDRLPSLSHLSEAIPNIPQLANRSPTTVKVWLENELVRRRSSSSFNKDNVNGDEIHGNNEGIVLSVTFEGGST
ncbi:uncharacterized protein LOC116164569 [Photinus pyralis]|uniref:uncharacterized protein LOC116164569 n=1 Tax=Photinus pyralis TaxID=7054 RepID=UPI00126749E6|nr:uncharacterized protein LOC116164569 [Photinus pyralis]